MTQGLGGFLTDMYGGKNTGPGLQNYFGGSQQATQGAQQGYQGLAAAARGAAAPQGNYSSAEGFGGMGVQTAKDAAAGSNAAFGQGYGGYQAAQGQQGAALGNLAAAAAGQGPSQAQIVANQGISNALQSQLAAAASARGGAYAQAAAQQGAQQQAAQLQGQAVGQGAALRAQEMQNAQNAYLQGSLGIGGQALQAAQAAGGQQLAAGQLASGAQLNMGQLQAGDVNANAGLQAQQNALNAQTGLGYEQLGYNVGAQNLQSANQTQQLQAQANQQNAQSNNQNGGNLVSGLMSSVGALAMLSDIRGKEAIAPQGAAPMARPAAGPLTAGQMIEASPEAAGREHIDLTAGPAFAQDYGEAFGAPAAAKPDMTKQGALAILQGLRSGFGGGTAGAAPAVGGIMSDEQTKGDSDDAASVADAYLTQLARSKATFAYKDDANQPVSQPRPHGARYMGIMSQALEKTPEIGPNLVTNTPRGKVLEGGANLSAALAGLGRLAERVKALEGGHGSR